MKIEQINKNNIKSILYNSLIQKYSKKQFAKVKDRLEYELSLLNDDQIEFFIFIRKTISSLNISSNLLFPELRAANSLILYLLDVTCIDPIIFGLDPDIFYKTINKNRTIQISIASPIKDTQVYEYKFNKLTIKADKDIKVLQSLFQTKKISIEQLKRISNELIRHLCGENRWCFDETFVDNNALGIRSFSNMFYIKDAMKKNTLNQLISVLPINYDGGVIDNLASAMIALGDNYENLPLTQDSLYKLLVNHNIPKDISLNISKSSNLQHNLSHKEKTELEKYNLHPEIISFIDNINYLIPLGHVITKAIIGLYLYYYKINNPKLFYSSILSTYWVDSIKPTDNHKKMLLEEEQEDKTFIRLIILEAKYRGLDIHQK